MVWRDWACYWDGYLSLWLCRYASTFQYASSSAKCGYQYSSGLHVWHSWTFSNWIEPTFVMSSGTRRVHTGHCRERIPTSKLHWFYRWNRPSNLKTFRHQGVLYNSHKRMHAVPSLYQMGSLEICMDLWKNGTKVSDNLLEGRKHDAGMHADSGLLTQYESFAFSPANLYLWRSCQYTLHSHFSAMLSSQPKWKNSIQPWLHWKCSVECLLGAITNYFKCSDVNKNQTSNSV